MSRLLLGTICGLFYGALSAASMIPLSFSDKRAALAGAFLNRFAIGFVIGAARLPLPSWLQGLIFGVLLSLPDAIITKAFAPILILGAVGGLVIGLIVGKWGTQIKIANSRAKTVITKLSDVTALVNQAITDPSCAFPGILQLAASDDWKEREVAATILVEAGKKRPGDIVSEMTLWADHLDPNVRRTASEGLRGIARKQPELVLPVIAKLNADSDLYVKKSVANVLRNMGNYHPELVLETCAAWAREENKHTAWIVKMD